MRMDVEVRPLVEDDLPEADRIFRMAFGTFLGLPDPMSFMGDADLVKTRWRAAPAATLGAYADGVLVGSNYAANWGSFGYFGPLTVRPDLWDRGIARRLLTATMDLFKRWGTRHAALFTFPDSPKHIGFYRKFDFWPQSLTPVMSKSVAPSPNAGRWTTYAEVPARDRAACLAACRSLTEAIHPGLDVRGEIEAAARQRLGDTVLVHDGADLVGFAICHLGAGTEAGGGTAYVKFGAAHPGRDAARSFDQLLSACEALACARGLAQLVAGVNTARHEAYRMMLARGFTTMLEGIAMQRHNAPGYNLPDRFVIDDWR
jgi:GNAT superfamily N-acetyltransferase